VIGMKILDGCRVRLRVDVATSRATVLRAGEVVTFSRQGVVRGGLRADDGRFIIGNFARDTFEVLDAAKARLAGYPVAPDAKEGAS
jgi:hypothetical protein